MMQALGKSTFLVCQVTAFPHATIYWEKSGQQITSVRHTSNSYQCYNPVNIVQHRQISRRQFAVLNYGQKRTYRQLTA